MNETLKTIHKLKSIREFANKEINKEDIETIISATLRTANSGGRQVYSIIIVEERELLKKFFYNANKALVFCIDYNRWMDCAKRLGYSLVAGDIRGFFLGATDAIMASQTAVIAAKALGIDSLVTSSVFRTKLDEVYKKLNLPEKYCFPLISVCLGYPDKENEFLKGRIRKGIIHYSEYHRLTDLEIDQVIAEYDIPENHFTTKTKEDFENEGKKGYLDNYFSGWNGSFSCDEIEDCYNTLKKVGFFEFMK
ncbi:MAG TPA: nitroreductase family protein [Candidatus Bathyarchaeia archaeon]|nr:nitroreductase family protein [Candidatus Bathyarchaeia archaeon]